MRFTINHKDMIRVLDLIPTTRMGQANVRKMCVKASRFASEFGRQSFTYNSSETVINLYA